MTAFSGREFLVLKDAVAIAGLRETSVSVDGSPIDITSKGDSGYRTLAGFAGNRALDITASGVLKDDVFRAIAVGTGSLLLTDITLQYADGATLSGDFYLATTEDAGNFDNEATYNVTLQSSGVWTYTASAAPTNTLAPAVSGTAQEGQTVTALNGTWTGAPSFSYQWQELISAVWTNIAGATSRTLVVPGGSTVGRPLRVQVTGTNTAGSATANSAATANVIGA
jgi:predicted secreted protein